MRNDNRKPESVSVVIPMYQAGSSIGTCLESIQAQKYPYLEIICINDGSTDQTEAVVKTYMEQDSRIHLYSQENAGVSKARNQGIARASGEYLVFCDSDDYLEETCIRRLMESRRQYQSEWVVAGYVKELGGKSIRYEHPYEKSETETDREFLEGRYKNNYLAGPCGKLYLCSILKEHGLQFPEGMDHGEDTVFNLEYIQYCRKISFVHKALYHYVERKDSLTGRNRKDIWQSQLAVYEAYGRAALRIWQNQGQTVDVPLFLMRGILISLNHARAEKWTLGDWERLCSCMVSHPDFAKINLEKIRKDKLACLTYRMLNRNRRILLFVFFGIKIKVRHYAAGLYYLMRR